MIQKLFPMLLVASMVSSAGSGTLFAQPNDDKPVLKQDTEKARIERPAAASDSLSRTIRREMATLPYYNVFDWLEADIQAGGKVVLHGNVLRHATRTDAQRRIARIEGVVEVVNEIRVARVSPDDDSLRLALYRSVYGTYPSLYPYAFTAIPSIHIIVEDGRATLKGVVSSAIDSQLAYTAARQTPGLFDVRNELRVEE